MFTKIHLKSFLKPLGIHKESTCSVNGGHPSRVVRQRLLPPALHTSVMHEVFKTSTCLLSNKYFRRGFINICNLLFQMKHWKNTAHFFLILSSIIFAPFIYQYILYTPNKAPELSAVICLQIISLTKHPLSSKCLFYVPGLLFHWMPSGATI